MKKLLRIVYDWPPKWDGLAPAPYEMTVSQKKLGYEIDVFCGRWPFAGPIAEVPGVKLYPFIREPLRGTLAITMSPLLFIYYLIWRFKNRPDIIHSHGHFAMYIYLYRKILKKFLPKSKELQIPLVVHFHNTVKGRWESIKKNGGKIKFFSKHLEWPLGMKSDQWAIDAADAYVFVGEMNKQQAIEYYGADPAKCNVVETGVNTELFSPVGVEEKGKIRSDLGIDPLDKVIVNIGAMNERKNIHVLIEAMTLLPPEYRLILVGDGKKEYMTELTTAIKEHKLESRIIRISYTPYPEIPIAFQVADIFVLPSSFEGFPKVVTESLACGVKVLASGFKAQDEVAGLHYLSTISAEAIAKEIQEVIQSGSPVNTAVINAYFSWDRRAKQIESIYEKIV